MRPPVAIVTAPDRAQQLAAALERTGFDVVDASSATSAAAIVIDLENEGDTTVAGLRERFPGALLAAFITTPDRGAWEGAQERFDLVATRGAIARQLATALEGWRGPRTRERIRLFDAGDATGRLGLIHAAETPVGPVAVYQLGKTMLAVGDECPHAGATLSKGEIEGTVITCPLHGSQFDLTDGSRVRGPADEPIPSYDLVTEGGIVYLEIDRA